MKKVLQSNGIPWKSLAMTVRNSYLVVIINDLVFL